MNIKMSNQDLLETYKVNIEDIFSDLLSGEVTSDSFRYLEKSLVNENISRRNFVIMCDRDDFSKFMRCVGERDIMQINPDYIVVGVEEFISLSSNGINIMALYKL